MVERFPDKKRARVSSQRITEYIQAGQQLDERLSLIQERATWFAYGEYPEAPIAVTYMTDIHYGNKDVDYNLMQHHINVVTSCPNHFVLIGGDMIDNFALKYPHVGILEDMIPPQTQADSFLRILTLLDRRGKLGAVQLGNHDLWLERAGMLYENHLRQLNCPIYDKEGDLFIKVGRGAENYHLWWGHTHWGKSKLNITNAPKRAMQFSSPGAEIALVGHSHQASGEIFDVGGQQRVAVVGGTYQLGGKLMRRWGLGKPGMPGYTLVLWPDRHRIDLFRDPEGAADYVQGAIRNLTEDPGWIDPYTRSL